MKKVTRILLKYQPLWSIQPFKYHFPPWRESYPELYRELSRLTISEIQKLDSSREELAQFLFPYIPESFEILELEKLPFLSTEKVSFPRNFYTGVKARKVRQVEGFCSALSRVKLSGHGLDWCSGKGHLARGLAYLFSRQITCLERNYKLCSAGKELASNWKLDIKFFQVDVLKEALDPYFKNICWITALHACGPLHRKVLEITANSEEIRYLALSPCCYFLDVEEGNPYRPFSSLGRRAGLQLNRDMLRLATQEIVEKKRNREVARQRFLRWRLGFDILQRELRGIDQYLQTPSTPRRMANLSFAQYCRHLARTVGLILPDGIDFDYYEELGNRRYLQFAPAEVPRLLFRRLLELWLVLDRAIFLEELDFSVELGLFCRREDSPRNILISAQRI